MSAKTTTLCPCQSSLSYEDCCGRFHSGNMFPETSEQLMRSRYSAFVLKKIPYIVQTTVPSQQTLLDEKARLNLKHIFKAANSRKCITNIHFL